MIRIATAAGLPVLAGTLLVGFSEPAHAYYFNPSDIVVSESTFAPNTGDAANLTPGSVISYPLAGGGPLAAAAGNPVAIAGDANLGVFTNVAPDGNFGITAPLSLVQINPATDLQDGSALLLPTARIVTSFSSKSEGSLYLSTNGQSLTIGGYDVAASGRDAVGALDVSNSNTTAANGASSKNSNGIVNRTIAQIGANGSVSTTDYNAYSGNNGRGATLANGTYYAVGNGNAGNVGVEAITPGASTIWMPTQTAPESSTQIGAYNITQNGYTSPGPTGDKPLKDNNFRGETIYNGTLYVTKGSGGNGINTVYQVGPTGGLSNGQNLAANAAISILPGFSTALAQDKKGNNVAPFTPFSLFFANATTLYVSDEGTGAPGVDSGPGSHAGLEKYSLINGNWVLDYTLQSGLIGTAQSYHAPGFTGTVTEDGLRDITGVVNPDGTVTIYGVTATADDITDMDNGADPNELVTITDTLADMTLPGNEVFSTVIAPSLGTVIRGVSGAPVPEPASLALLATAVGSIGWLRRRRTRSMG